MTNLSDLSSKNLEAYRVMNEHAAKALTIIADEASEEQAPILEEFLSRLGVYNEACKEWVEQLRQEESWDKVFDNEEDD